MTDTASTPSATPSVFVGNLPNGTDEASLLEFFTKDGKVQIKSVKVNPGRRLYGFVHLHSDADVKKVIELYNDKDFNGNNLVLEVAKPPAPRLPRKPRTDGGNGTAPADSGADGAVDGEGRKRRRPRRRRTGGDGTDATGADGSAPQQQHQPQHQGGGQQGGQQTQGSGDAPRARRPRRPRREGGVGGDAPTGNAPSGSGSAPAAGGEPRTRRPRPPRTPGQGGDSNREPINPMATLFVANLPFAVDDARLREIMAVPNGSITSARVILGRASHSKGYGFVTYSDTNARDAACATHNGQDVDGRALKVNVAKAQPPNAAPAATN